MMQSISGFSKRASQDDLVEAFAQELAALESASALPETVTASDLVGLVVKCAEQLESAGLDAGAADAVLAEFESE